MRKILSALLWYVIHAGVLSVAFVVAFPLHFALVIVIPATLMAVGVLSLLQAKRAGRRFDLPLLFGVGCAGLSLSAVLLLIDWAAASDARALTIDSFARYLRLPLGRGGFLIIYGPVLLLLASSLIGLFIGHAIKNMREPRAGSTTKTGSSGGEFSR
jgi:hypothetical protein